MVPLLSCFQTSYAYLLKTNRHDNCTGKFMENLDKVDLKKFKLVFTRVLSDLEEFVENLSLIFNLLVFLKIVYIML